MSDDYKDMPRLARWLRNIEATGLLPADALVLLNPEHPSHEALFQRVASRLPDHVRADFESLRASTARGRAVEVESVVNQLLERIGPERSNEDT